MIRLAHSLLAAALLVAGLAFLTAAPVEAQTADAAPAGRQDIELPEFRELFMGKTVYFRLEDGTRWGREYYKPGGQESVFVFENGPCFEGRWDKVDDRYCFYYREEASCWLTFWENEEIYVVSRTGMRQQIDRIVESEPLSCEPEGVSFAPRSSTPAG